MNEKSLKQYIEKIKLLQKRIVELEIVDSGRKQQQQESRRLATVVRDSNDVITIQDFKGQIIAWNHGAELMYGYSEKEALQINIERLTHPGKVAEQKEFTHRLIAGEAITSFETQRVAKDGRILDVWLTVTKLVDDTGKPVGIASTERDITERKRAEEAVRENETRLRTVLETVKEGIIFSDKKGYFEVYNAEMERLTGYTKEEANESDDFIALLYPNAKESRRARERLGALLRETREQEFESLIQRKDGQLRHVLVYSVVIPYQNRKMFLSTFRDITGRTRTEEVLRESESRYRLLADNATDIIWTSDMNLSFTYFSPYVMRVLGYTAEEMLTKRIEDFLTPDSIQLAGRVLLEEIAKDSLPGADLSRSRMLELQHIRKDGAIIWVEIRISFLRDQAHRPMGILGITRDITERKLAEEVLKESEERFRAIFDNANDGMLLADRETKKFYIGNSTACQMLGYSLEEIKNLGVTDIHPKGDLPYVLGQFERQIRREIAVAKDLPVKRKDGSVFYADVNTSLVTLAGRTYLLGIFRDITERKKMEETSRLAQLGGLVAAMAHEVNNPLMIISGNAQLCLMEEIQSDAVKNNLKIIVEECRRAKDIIQRLLKFSRPSKGENKEVDINKSIEVVVSIVEHQFKLVNVEIKRNYLEGPPLISVDEPQMQEVFMNLINNASEAMPGGGAITITTSLGGDFFRIDFKDIGCGMSEETKKKLFEPFFTTKEKGTGLGLAICCGILKAHNGEIKFESELNKGATATVLLPLKQREGGVEQSV